MTDTTASPQAEDAQRIADDFFERYAAALLDRDAAKIAEFYGVPALVEFPGRALPVDDRAQTEQFFSQAMGQYDGVATAVTRIVVVARTPDSIWADVAWDYDGAASGERNMYQLAKRDGDWQIAVLTPLGG